MTKKLTMNFVRETTGTVLYGTTDGDRDLYFYVPKTWLTKSKQPKSIAITVEMTTSKKEE
jgi:hypothetical protein